MEESVNINPQRTIARAASTIMLAFIISQLAGLARRILVASAFGASAELDAFIAANRVSETLFNLIAGGALGSAFIPTFTSLLIRKESKSAWRLASAVGNLVLILLSLLGCIAYIFAPQIVKFALAPGLTADPALFDLTIHLLRIQLVSAILFGISGLLMGILNSHKKFLIPALTPAMYQAGIIFGVLCLSPSIGIYGLAWGVVIGAALHLGLQLPSLFSLKGNYSITLGMNVPEVHQVIKLIGPRLLGVAVVQVNFWVNSWLATQMSRGSLVGVDYAFSLMLMAQVVIAQSIATALLPTLSSFFALGDLERFKTTFVSAIRGVLFLAIPASIGLILLRNPLIILLYQRGNFTQNSTNLVAWALLWYSAGLVGHAVLEILARAFYSLQDTRTPVFVGIFAMFLNVVLSFSLSTLFNRVGWMPHGALALANTIATTLEAIVLYVLMNRRIPGVISRRVMEALLKALSAGLLMGLVLFFGGSVLKNFPVWMFALISILAGGGIYILLLWLFRVSELREITGYLTSRRSH